MRLAPALRLGPWWWRCRSAGGQRRGPWRRRRQTVQEHSPSPSPLSGGVPSSSSMHASSRRGAAGSAEGHPDLDLLRQVVGSGGCAGPSLPYTGALDDTSPLGPSAAARAEAKDGATRPWLPVRRARSARALAVAGAAGVARQSAAATAECSGWWWKKGAEVLCARELACSGGALPFRAV
jgi:hypothetical protein